jgi:hypothetical protein
MTKNYYGIWNMLDIVRIILIALYVIFTIMYLLNKPALNENDDALKEYGPNII